MDKVLQALLYASERAANIARSCCTDEVKKTLLVAEKSEGEANSRFDKDFKTIADVLAQEAARHEIALRCPELSDHLRGEECSEINGISIKICENEEKTAELLEALIPVEAAKTMAKAAHANVNLQIIFNHGIPRFTFEEDDSLPQPESLNLGIWIDPIDATAEFIAGVRGEADNGHGLPCVTVLIGAYDISTGEPVIGVINQPFVSGGIFWGYSLNIEEYLSNIVYTDRTLPKHKTVLMSSAENPEITEKFKALGWNVISVPGAGNKLTTVAKGIAHAYIVSKGTTYRWDTCAPHAILRALGGDIVCYTTHESITYNDPENADTQKFANSGGIIAYSHEDVLEEILKVLN